MTTAPAPLSLAITTSCTGYGQYLGEWARSIVALTRKPTEVCLFTHGTDADAAAGKAAHAVLAAAGLAVEWVHEPALLDFGTARNRAVALTTAEWVLHLDADDMLMPHALDDVAALAPHADIVALGYERCGDLKSGPRQPRKLYRSTTGPDLLHNITPASGVSPYRRSFWERSPYRTDLAGGWDTALWIGFAHLGARCVATTRPCFWYRQHADSVFNTRRLSGWPAEKAGKKLQSLRRGDRGVTVVVPRAPGDGAERARAWVWLRERYAALFSDWEVVEGFCHPRVWRKGEAVNDALTRAHGDVIVLADADCLAPAAALRDAVQLVRDGAPWVIPHGLVHRLTAAQTEGVYALAPAQTDMVPLPESAVLDRPAYQGYAGGGMVVVGRSNLEATGGIPLSFYGWGFEDQALAIILDTMLGRHTRLDYPLVHLWHPPVDKRLHRSNNPVYQRLQRLAGNPEGLWSMLRPEARVLRPGSPAEINRQRAEQQAAQREQTQQRIQLARQRTTQTLLSAPTPRKRTPVQERHLANIAAAAAARDMRASRSSTTEPR